MIGRTGWWLAAIAAVSVIAGCAGGRRSRPASMPALDPAHEEEAAQALGLSIERGLAWLTPMAPSFAPSCGIASGDLSDSDGDGIPAGATLTFTSCVSPAGSAVSGSETVADTTATADFSFQSQVDLTEVSSGTAPQQTVHVTGSLYATQTVSDLLFDNGSASVTAAGAPLRDETRNFSYGFVIASPWLPVQPLPVGDAAQLDGDWTVVLHPSTGDLGSDVSVTGMLNVDPACPSRVGAGSIASGTYDDSHGTSHTFGLSWPACGALDVTLSSP